jgi:hypothetical protein
MADKNIQMTQRNSGNTDWDNLYPKTKTENVIGIDDYAIAAQEAWLPLTLLNGWVANGSGFANAGYRKNNNGEVEIRGLIKSGSVANGSIIATLPVGYRPATNRMYLVQSYDTGSAFSRIIIEATGNIVVYEGKNTMLSLDGIPPIPTV